jgi:hypothetical protein
MINTLKKRMNLLMFLLLAISLISCASTAPLPSNITFIESSPAVSPNLSAFLGIWKGKWHSSQAVTLVIESVDSNYVDLIFSVGAYVDSGIDPQNSFYYVRGKLVNDKTFGWKTVNNNKFIFEMQDGFQEIKGYFFVNSTGEKINVTLIRSDADKLSNVTIHKYPYVGYTHSEKSSKEFDHDNDLCWWEAEKQTAVLPSDIRRYKMWEEVDRCLRDDFGWKPTPSSTPF